MTYSINNTLPGSKRACEEEEKKRQKLGSTKISRPSNHLEKLPLEIMEIVAKHLTEQKDLKSFSEISSLTKCSVLNVINIQNEKLAAEELRVFCDMNPSKQEHPSSAVDLYKHFLEMMRNPSFLDSSRGVQIDVNKLQELQQLLKAFVTNQVAERLTKLKLECYQEIIKGKESIANIDDKYSNLKCALVSEALNHIITYSINPISTRRCALIELASFGHTSLVQAFLGDGTQISQDDRGWAIKAAADNGHLSVIQALLANEAQIFKEDLGGALCNGAFNNHLPVVEFLLPNQNISQEARGLALSFAARKGYLSALQAILTHGGISVSDKGNALRWAAEKGHLSVIQALLNDGEISQFYKNLSFRTACAYGHLEVVKCLLANGARFSSADKESAISSALGQGHHAVADFLRQN